MVFLSGSQPHAAVGEGEAAGVQDREAANGGRAAEAEAEAAGAAAREAAAQAATGCEGGPTVVLEQWPKMGAGQILQGSSSSATLTTTPGRAVQNEELEDLHGGRETCSEPGRSLARRCWSVHPVAGRVLLFPGR